MDVGLANVLVVGAGGLGSPATLALAHAPVASLSLVDPDDVEATNLPRQLWQRPSDIGRHKTDCAAGRLKTAFPNLRVETLRERVTEKNADALFIRHDVVID